MASKEKRNQKLSAVVSVGVHGVLFIVFFLMLAWTEPDPPIPEFGIELDFGSEAISESQVPAVEQVMEEMEEVLEEVATDPSENSEEADQNALQEEENQLEDANEAEPLTEDIHSPDLAEETETMVAETAQVETAEQSTEDEEINEKKEEIEEKKEEPQVDERAIFKRNPNADGGQDATGSSLELAGWDWDFRPEPNDKSSENGLIVFQITIDNEGEIIKIKTLKKTVSPVVEKVYKDAVRNLTFSKNSDYRAAATTSTGKITFIIQSN